MRVKNTVFNALKNKLDTCEGTWTDKAELFASTFTDIVPAAALEATVAIRDLQDYSTTVFTFSNIKLVDSNFRPLPPGVGADWPVRTHADVRFFKLTLTADPRNINPGALDIDPALFPTHTATTVFLRALRINNGVHPQVTKILLEQTPKMLIDLYTLNGMDFTLAQKTHYESAPNPDTQKKWHAVLTAKTKYAVMIQLVRTLYVGRMEGTESMSQRILKIKQRSWNPETKQVKYKSIMELGAEFQYVLNEITAATHTDEIPNLENTTYQALSHDLQITLVNHLHQAPPTSVRQNVAQFNEFLLQAATEEKQLKTIANIADRTFSRQNRNSYRPGPNQGPPRTFMGFDQKPNTAHTQHAQHTGTPPTKNAVVLPYAFVCTPTSQCTKDQQDIMVQAITTMDEMVESLTAVSIVEEALQRSSGMRAPIKCFGCDGIEEYANNCYHLWRNCPNKNDKRVWTNFQTNLAEWRNKRKD